MDVTVLVQQFDRFLIGMNSSDGNTKGSQGREIACLCSGKYASAAVTQMREIVPQRARVLGKSVYSNSPPKSVYKH